MAGRLSLRWWILALTAVVAALPTPAAASGFQLVEQNASGLGNAFAGQAAGARDASAVFFNPAALTRVSGWNVVASVEPIGVNTTFANSRTAGPSAGSFPFPVQLGDEGGNAGGWIPVPNTYVSGQLSKRIWVGAGVNAPFGLETDWDPTWMGRFYATKSKVQTINVNPTVAVKVTDKLSLGAGVDWQHLKADLGQNAAYGGIAYAGAAQALAQQGVPPANQLALLAGIVAQLGPSERALEGPVLISGTSNAWGWNAGALLDLGSEAHVGVSYRSKITHDVEGTVTFTDAPALLETGPTGAIGSAINARFKNGPVQTKIELPDTLSVAAAWENDKLALLADWTWTGWDKIQSLDISRPDATPVSSVPLRFQNTWRAGLGANYKVDEQWTVRLGTAYDKSPVQDEFRTPRLPDNDRVWLAGGVQFRPQEKVHIDLGYAHLIVDKGSSDLRTQTTSGALVGEYTAKVDIVGAQVTLAF